MPGKKIGDPCPKCAAMLMRRPRASLFRMADGDMAFCARCNAARDIVGEEQPSPLTAAMAAMRPLRTI
jgi:hypothetical protein